MKKITALVSTMVLACGLAAGAEVAPRFAKAVPVWPQGLEREMNTFIGFRAAFEVKGGEKPVLRLTGSSDYRISLDGKHLGWGPARAAKGYFRVDELPLKVAAGWHTVAVEVAGYNCNSYCLMDQPPFLEAEVVAGGRVLAATGANGEFSAKRLPRVQKVARYSFQRSFSEFYRLKPGFEGWKRGEGDFAALPLAERPAVKHLPRRAPYADFRVNGPFKPVSRAKVQIDPHQKKREVRFVSGAGLEDNLIKGWQAGELEENWYDRIQEIVATGRRAVTPSEAAAKEFALGQGESMVFSAGLNDTGFLGLRVRCLKPGRLAVKFDEILVDGEVSPVRYSCTNVIAWEFEEPGEYEVEAFEPYTLMYADAIAVSGDFAISAPYLRTYKNPEASRAKIKCSDPAIVKIFEAARETYAQNAADVFTDCPGRERAGWLCDSFFTGRSSQLFTGNLEPERLFLENFQLPDSFESLPKGMFAMCYPGDHPNGNFIPNWAMWLVYEVEEYAKRGGDPALVAAFRPRILALVDYLKGFYNSDGLLEKLPKWVFVEWSRANKLVQDVNYPSNMAWAEVLDAVNRLYSMPELAAEAQRIRETVRRQSWTGKWFCDNAVRQKDGTLKLSGECTETCQYYAFFFRTATPATHPELWRTLVADFGPKRLKTKKHPEIHPSNAFIGNYLRLECLARENLSAEILEETHDFFLYMAERTGTLWEHVGTTASCNHGFASHAAVSYCRDVLGLRKIDHVNRTVTFAPPADLPLGFISMELPVKEGVIRASWRKKDGKLTEELSLPPGWRREGASAAVLWKNGEWQFTLGGKTAQVTVPHDWAIAGPFDPNVDGGSGKLPWKGKGEYRRQFAVDGLEKARAAGERYYLEFDGVMARPQVFVNGVFAGGWDYGYMSFQLDVTELLREGTNDLLVKCDTTGHHSRWYPGAGIYREVRFVRRGKDHVIPGSLAITTPKVSKTEAVVHVAYDSPVKGHVEFDRTIANPRLWDVDDPYLYEIEILGERFRYGIRTFAFTADDGFHLNGRRVQLKGVDLHSDMGPLGMAFDRDVMKRQLLVMKDMGVNALRTSHNAPDPKVLELCDEMGIVVWDECFDKWDRTAGRNADENLETYVAHNLRQFVRRDRNHPSVVVWSIGNEIPPNGYGWNGPDPKQKSGMSAARFREFREAIRELDTTRPVGIGCCHGNAIASGMFAELDLTGWNYGANYRRVKAKHPEKPCVYSESASALSDYGYYGSEGAKYKVDYDFTNWKVCGYDHCAASWSDIPDVEFDRMETDRYCAGEFVWTGIDYLGEPTPLWSPGQHGVPKNTPYSKLARSSYFGIADLMGVPKDRYYLYRSYWNRKDETVHILPHWNWSGREGGKVPVYVYTSGDEAELFLNGRSLGRRRKATEVKRKNLAAGAKASASSEQISEGTHHLAADALDGRHETRWCAASGATNEWWQLDFGKVTAFKSISIEFEQAQVRYEIRVMLSDDGIAWREHFHKPLQKDAAVIVKSAAARFVRVVFESMQYGVWATIERVFVSDEEEMNPYYDVCAKYRLRWFDVPYEPGELKAVAYRGGVKVGEDAVRTAGKPVAVKLTESRHNAPEAITQFYEVDLVDQQGVRDPLATNRVNFAITGPGEIVAVGNGDPRAFESFKAVASHPLYYGKAAVVVRRRGEGEIRLTASVPGLKPAVVTIAE